MFPINVSQLSQLLNGVATGSVPGKDVIKGACIDSRHVTQGDCFFALTGERTHGLLYADEAIARGAACIVAESGVSRMSQAEQASVTPQLAAIGSAETEERILRVENSVAALQSMARWNRQQSSALVIGITGSVGKSTTRQMIAHVLSTRFSGVQSPRNYNNELGVPLTLSLLKPDDDFAVVELAAARPGDIDFLTNLVQPEFAVVTCVTAVHLESFENLDAIRQTKMELPAALQPGTTVFLNADDPMVCSMQRSSAATAVTFGRSSDAHFRATLVQSSNGFCSFQLRGQEFRIQGGQHLITAATAAIAVGCVAGIPVAEIAQRLACFEPDAGRGRIVQRQPWTVIDESYNASPASVLASMQTLSDYASAARRILVLGDMLELGSDAKRFHSEVGRSLGSQNIDHTLLFGEFADTVASAAMQAGISPNRVSVFSDIHTLNAMLDCVLTSGDVVLIKGSRSTCMERVVAALSNDEKVLSLRRAA